MAGVGVATAFDRWRWMESRWRLWARLPGVGEGHIKRGTQAWLCVSNAYILGLKGSVHSTKNIFTPF